MVSGKPYISVNSATRKAENALNDRQSRLVRGFAKLKAKMMNTAELMTTRGQRPYAGTSFISAPLFPARHRGRSPVTSPAVLPVAAVSAVSAVHEDVQEWA